MADNDREALADLLVPLIGGTYTAVDVVPAVADAILARWRLVPVDVADLITQARTEGWYDGDPAWEPIDKALGVQR